MKTQHFVALLRGVNIGGGNRVIMADLRRLAEGLGWQDVQSYIASGNLLFRTAGEAGSLADELRSAMARQLGVDVPVLVLPRDALHAALKACPFAPEAGRHVQAFFLLSDAVTLDTDLLEKLRAPSETLTLGDRLAWLHTPEGMARSKLAGKLHKVVRGTEMTARNLNTLRALCSL